MVAQTLIGNPDIIILDEPTVGLDPKQIIEIRTLIKQLGEDHTVLISSHILSEIGAVCDHVVIINKGHAESHPDFLMKNRCVWWPEPGVSTSIFRKNL